MKLEDVLFAIVVMLMLFLIWFFLVVVTPPIDEVEIQDTPEKPTCETVIMPRKVGGRCPRKFVYFCN